MLFGDVPQDVFSLIALYLPVRDISSLCQISKRFREFVVTDKQLWLDCLRKDVLSKGIALPKYRQSVEESTADDVHSWVKTAIQMHNAYKSGGQGARVTSFGTDYALEATWAKIVRGRWCMVALSNPSTSFIGVWEIHVDGSVGLVERFYLPGPVMDGVVDDDELEIRIAVTIGTTCPHIHILLLGVKDHSTCLLSLQTLRGARHVLFLSSFFVGYRTLYGDDTYPLVSDWRTGATVRLYPAHFRLRPNELLANAHTPCRAMGVWRGYIFAIFNVYVEMFWFPSFDTMSAMHLGSQCLFFPELRIESGSNWICEAFICEIRHPPDGVDSVSMQESLLISIRDRYGNLYNRAILQERGSFVWDSDVLDEPELDSISFRHCVGSSCEYQLRLASEEDGKRYPVFLDLLRVSRSSVGRECLNPTPEVQQNFGVINSDLPILDLITGMDFDDAAGIILLGNCRGEISVIQFTDRSSQSSRSLRDDLPRITISIELPQLETSPICIDLPICYRMYDGIHKGSVPAAVREEVMNTWNPNIDFPKINPPLGWSADWGRHASFQNWVLPFPRWRTLAADQPFHFDETWNRVILAGLGHGDIVPIMYKEEDPNFVVFRISSRIYFFLRGPSIDPRGHLICALPFSVEELSDPGVLAHLWSDRWRVGRASPCKLREDRASIMLLYRTTSCLAVLMYLKTDAFQKVLASRCLSEDVRTWSFEDRRILFKKADDLWDAGHKDMNPPPSEDFT